MTRASCAHCGLPVSAPMEAGGEVFCCYGCYLVSRIVGAQDRQGPRAWSLLRLSFGALLAMNVMMLSLLLYTDTVEAASVPAFRWILLGLSTPAMILLGCPFALGALRELARRRLSLDTLIAVGSFSAFAVSAVNTIRGEGYIYFDTATMLPTLVVFGKLIEATAKSRTGMLVRELEMYLPARAVRLGPAGPEEVEIEALRAGDNVQVTPGGRIPVDGRILSGRAVIEEAAFTGESAPRLCGPGDAVLAGTVAGTETLTVRAEHVGEDILLRRIIGMMEDARRTAAPSERIAERIAAGFIPLVLLLAAGAGLFWGVSEGWLKGGAVALAVVVVACPCAMGIATPLATALAMGRAAREGVLVRGGDVLERIGQITTAFFDKTGTVTTNHPQVVAVEVLDGATPDAELLGCAATLESGSEHSLARAIVAEARKREVEAGRLLSLEAVPGMGVRGKIQWRGMERTVVAGTEEFARAGGGSLLPPAGYGTVVCVAWDGKVRGRITLADEIRPGAAASVEQLRRQGISTALLSGDRAEVADAIGRRVGVDRVEAPRLPEQKILAVRAAEKDGHVAAMVGDGINDAPALAAAGVGIALGAGTDIARQSGNVVLLSDRLEQIPWLIRLSRYTRRIVMQNLLWAFGYNAVALAAAAMGWLHPLLAALAMVVSSVTVLGNSLRIQRFPAVNSTPGTRR